MALSRSEISSRFRNLSTWRRGKEKAPHKPLLLLLALGRLQQKKERLVAFEEIEERLTRLLESYGPSRKSYHPEYPFWRLQNDGLWEVPGGADLPSRKSNTDPPVTVLRERHVKGGFRPEVFRQLQQNPQLLREAARSLLEGTFYPQEHGEILQAVGLDVSEDVGTKPRDPDFPPAVLDAYGHRCVVCGYQGIFKGSDLGLEAGHIKRHSAGGPCVVQNGLAFCVMHHRAFERGAIGLDDSLKLLVSPKLCRSEDVEQWFLAYRSKPIASPYDDKLRPALKYVRWHRTIKFEKVDWPTEEG